MSFISLIRNQKFEFINGDFSDKKILDKAMEGITDVVVLGGLVGDPITKKYPNESKLINDLGITEVIESLKNKSLKVVFISTCSNYGLIEGSARADENFELNHIVCKIKARAGNI